MASANLESLRSWFRETEHPVWYHAFTSQEREHMVEDDLAAGYRIPILLTSIVFFGLATMAVSVLLDI